MSGAALPLTDDAGAPLPVGAPLPAGALPPAGAAPPAEETPLARALRGLLADRIALGGLVMLALIVLAAILAPLLSPQDPYDLARVDVLDARLRPGETASEGFVARLGTDGVGRDLWSGILHGLRISIAVGLASTVISALFGVGVGLVAAYAGGRVEALLMRIVDLQLSLPSVLVALVLVAALGKGADKIVLALVVVQWAIYARTVRSGALVERRKEYVEAARGLGLSHARVMLRHVLPNCLSPVIVVGTVQAARAIGLEATLSFLGVGLPQTEPSLGVLIANGFQYMLSGSWWISVFPGLALLALIVALNLVGDRLRDLLNPRLER